MNVLLWEARNLWNPCPVGSANPFVPALCFLFFPFQMAALAVVLLFLPLTEYVHVLERGK